MRDNINPNFVRDKTEIEYCVHKNVKGRCEICRLMKMKKN